MFYNGTEDIEKTVDSSVVSCIEDGILKDFLIAHRAEVIDMCLTEFDEKTFVNGIKEEGREEGDRERLIRQICRKLRKGKTVSEIADELEEAEIRVKVICDAVARFAPEFNEKKAVEAVLKSMKVDF